MTPFRMRLTAGCFKRNLPPTYRHAFKLVLALILASPDRARAQRDSASAALFRSISWAQGPVEGHLGTIATVSVPSGCAFTAAEGAKTFMEATQNPPSGNEQGVILCRASRDSSSTSWFVIYEFDQSGYVKDDEKATLDKDKIYAAIEEGTKAGNKERRARGWAELTMGGWVRPPYYDDRTHNLTWGLRVLSINDTSVNQSVRLLGRRGVMKAELVIENQDLLVALPTFESLVAGTTFLPGNTYGEWRQGDKVAAYGLTALVAGGAGAAAMKLGLFGKLWKLLAAFFAAAAKAIIAVVVAAAAWVRNLFRRKPRNPEVASPPTQEA
jgi:uncharacterized membrane-anchored protein